MKLVWSLVLVMGLMVAALGFAQGSRVRLEAVLIGSGNDKGKAKWETRDDAGQMQAQLQVEGENLVPNATLIVSVGANTPWSVQTDAFGAFRLSQLYLGAIRPSVPAGSSVIVTDAFGKTILHGTLMPN